MAPILCLLRSLAERGIDRPAPSTTTAPAPRPTCSTATSSRRWRRLPDFRFVPALSEGEWDGETGLITDVVERLEEDFADVDAYVCGPPPMVDARDRPAEGQGRSRVAHLFRQVHDDRDRRRRASR